MKITPLLFIYVCFAVALVDGRHSSDEYSSDENIIELNPSNFDQVIYESNYTTIVKFYAPWCGYCQRLKPIYKKLGKFMNQESKYAVQVASVNCDKESNKQLCLQNRVEGYPTLTVFRPPKYTFEGRRSKSARHAVETYNGERALSPMISFLNSRIKNYVKLYNGIESKAFQKWVNNDDRRSLVLFFKNSQSVSPLFKSLAIDFLSQVRFALIATKEKEDIISKSIIVNGEAIELDLEADEDLPILAAYDSASKTFKKYSTKNSMKDKDAISSWIIEALNVTADEGSLSKDKKHKKSKSKNTRNGKKKAKHDEL